MDEKFFLNSPSQSPFKTPFSSTADTDHPRNGNSPIKKECLSFSPFKNSGLSPFKLINQSPSKGSYDEWDKEFIASFEETLFGMEENVAPHVIEDILKSPAGKAMIENRTSPSRMRNPPAVRRLKISPQNKNTTNSFQCLSQSNNNNVGSMFNCAVVKEEVTTNDHLFEQTMVCVNSNTLSAIDPNKMCATPIHKPGLAACENVPRRKLAMREPGNVQPFQTFVFQENALSGIQQIENDLPSKERLKFARLQFQKVLNMAVEKEIEILQEERKKKEQMAAKASEKENRKQSKDQITKPTKGKGKQKRKGRKSKHERPVLRFPEIKMALSNPSSKKIHESKQARRGFVREPKINQLGWYPSDEDDEDNDSKWTGPVPFQAGKNNLYFPEEEEESSEDDDLYSYKYETQSGRQVTWKRRRLY